MENPDIITFVERKKWYYYKTIKKLSDFPTVPKRIEETINSSKVPYGEDIKISNNLDKISLKSFRNRVSKYEKTHLLTRDVSIFNPSFILNKK